MKIMFFLVRLQKSFNSTKGLNSLHLFLLNTLGWIQTKLPIHHIPLAAGPPHVGEATGKFHSANKN